MRDNRKDSTIWRNYVDKYRFLIKEYEQVKRKEHLVFKLAKDFYKAHDTCGKSFLKYYNRYKQSGKETDLIPGKRDQSTKPVDPFLLLRTRSFICERKAIRN